MSFYPRPLNGKYPGRHNLASLDRTMEQLCFYLREHYRLPVAFPIMFAGAGAIGEGTITNHIRLPFMSY